jgi:hypothetical protein
MRGQKMEEWLWTLAEEQAAYIDELEHLVKELWGFILRPGGSLEPKDICSL